MLALPLVLRARASKVLAEKRVNILDQEAQMEQTEAGAKTGRSMTDRMMGAAMLDNATYEEVEHDSSATTQAAIVVGIVAICAAIGSAGEGGIGAITALISALVGWLVWSGVTYVIGDKVFGGTATWGELLRTLGFAQSPGVLYILGVIPILGALASVAAWIWILVAGIIAIRQALDFSTGKAILTALLGMAAYVAVAIVFGILAGAGGLLM